MLQIRFFFVFLPTNNLFLTKNNKNYEGFANVHQRPFLREPFR